MTDPHNGHNPSPDATPWYNNQIFRQILGVSAICVALTGIYKFIDLFKIPVDLKLVKTVLEMVNFIILMAFCLYSIKVPALHIKKPEPENEKKLALALNIHHSSDDLSEKVHKNIQRVNILAKQLNDNIIFYALTLMIVYLVFFLQGTSFKPFSDDIARGLTDIFNYLSAVFIYLGFKVLYNKTLDDENNRIIYYMDAIFLSFFFILTDVILFDNKNPAVKYDLSLLSGIANGLAMGLLFSRFISMELNFIDIFKNPHFKSIFKYRRFFYFGTIFILPLYALFQPLFGDLPIKEFGDPDILAAIVFFICFIGKLFFLIMLVIYIKKRLIHIYLHLVISKYGISHDLVTNFRFDNKN